MSPTSYLAALPRIVASNICQAGRSVKLLNRPQNQNPPFGRGAADFHRVRFIRSVQPVLAYPPGAPRNPLVGRREEGLSWIAVENPPLTAVSSPPPARRTGVALAHLALIVLIGAAIYLPALSASFHLDDSPSIRDNAAIRHLGDLRAIWSFWPTRFFTYLSLALNFHFSQLDPLPYHAANVAIHLANALLVYALSRRLFPGRAAVALLSSLVFLCHPLQTQAVTYVVQRATSLAAFFYLFSVLCYLKARCGSSASPGRRLGRDDAPVPSCKRSDPTSPLTAECGQRAILQAKRYCIFYVLSFLSGLGAMLAKEFAFSLPLTLALAEWLLVRDAARSVRRRALILLPFLLSLLLIPSLVYLHRDYPCYNDSGQIEWAKRAGIIDRVASGHGGSPRDYLLTQPRVLVTYLRLIAFPADQRVEYDYPKIFSPFQLSAYAPLLILFSILIAAGAAIRRKYIRAAFGLLWFIIVLVPESSVIPILDACVEHRLYLPLAGGAFLAGSFLESAGKGKRITTVFFALGLALLALLAYRRNLAWRDPITLWEDNVVKAEGKARVHGNLGKAYLDAGRFEKAAREFKRMIELDPTFVGAYNNLAVIYIDHLKDYEEAKKYISLALALFPDYPAGYLNLGVIHLNNRQLKPAIENFKKVLDLDPKNLLAFYNLAACYVNLGDLGRAEECLRKGLSYWPEEPRFYLLLSRICREKGDIPAAEEWERRLQVREDPGNQGK